MYDQNSGKHYDYLTLCLIEDVFGANGQLTKKQIHERLVRRIRGMAANWDDADDGRISVNAAAGFLLRMYRHMSS